jgi:hypothetical protein
MKIFFTLLFLSAIAQVSFASADTVKIPINRKIFHEKIDKEQQLTDKADGKLDNIVKVSKNDEVNLQITDAIFRKIDELQNEIELNPQIKTNNEKIRYLGYVETLVKNFRSEWKAKEFNAVLAPVLVENFINMMNANIGGQSIEALAQEADYEIAKINTEIFNLNIGYPQAKKIVYLKFCALNPDKILQTIRPYIGESFADSLVLVASKNNPVQVYSYAQAKGKPEGKLIRRNNADVVKLIVQLSETDNSLFYFPFLDDLLKKNKTIEGIKKYVGDGSTTYNNVGYFKLLVQTEIDYSKRLVNADTPIAMFGTNGLRYMLQTKAIKEFITPINELHDQSNLNIRMKAIDPLSPIDLYYMMVMGESEIYTSSYKHSFNRMLQRMGKKPATDSLLRSVNYDYFKKFIKMAANYNKLDDFLDLMPAASSEKLMKDFVYKLEATDNLEDAVDVADAYSSITNKVLLKNMLQYVAENEQRCVNENNAKGQNIYSLLQLIFLSADSSNKIDLTKEVGIPSIYEVEGKYLADDSGRIVQQVFFYGDKDGQGVFNGFVNSFNRNDWRVEMKPEWVEIKSIKGSKIWVYANRPLDSDKNLDDSAQAHLNKYLNNNGLLPAVVIHRGHSYWLPGTIKRMQGDAKIIVLGSCGGYKNLNEILAINPDAHIISTKEIGRADINRPILNYLNQTFLSGKTLSWRSMWATLTKTIGNNDRECWESYIPPYKNLGAIFLKAYNRKAEVN